MAYRSEVDLADDFPVRAAAVAAAFVGLVRDGVESLLGETWSLSVSREP